MKVCGIYKIINSLNGKVYVGKSVNIWKRWQSHKDKLVKGVHFNTHLQASYNTHGSIYFTCEVIEECAESDLSEREKYWIIQFNSKDNQLGYNKVDGGLGGTLNSESLEKMSNSLKGRKLSDETKLKISKALKGKSRPQEVKDRISSSKTGQPKTDIHKQKISDSLKGRPLSEETRLKMSLARKGKPQTIVSCPNCKKQGGTAMYRWHFERCKQK